MESMNAESFANELFPYLWDYFKVDSQVRPQRTTKPSTFFKKSPSPEAPKSPEPMPSTSQAPGPIPPDPTPQTSPATSEPPQPTPQISPATSEPSDPVPPTSPPPSEDEIAEEILPKLARAVLGMQICFRSDLKVVFDGIPSLDIKERRFMEFVFKYLETFEVDKNIFERTLDSCVIYAEFALYKYQMKQENYFKLIPSLWCKYFEMYLKTNRFEISGSWKMLKQTAMYLKEAVTVVNETLIENFSSPYDTVELLEDVKRLIPELRERLDLFVTNYNSDLV